MSKLKPHQNKTVEEYWMSLSELKEQLEFREWQLLNEWRETDTNTGGGRSSGTSDKTAQAAIKLAEDERYQHLKKVINAIESTYKTIDDEMKTMVKMRYWFDKIQPEWEEIADVLYMSRNKVLRMRNYLIDETAKKIGWL